MKDRTPRESPTREMVLDYLEKHPDHGTKRDIARGLHVSGEDRVILREILSELEKEGALTRTAKRAWSPSETPPPTGIVKFERIDSEGDLIGRAVGRDGPYGPDIHFVGAAGKSRSIALGVGERALCRVDKGADGTWRAKAIKKIDAAPDLTVIGVYRANKHGGVVEPTSRKEKFDYIIERDDAREAKDGDIVRIAPRQSRGYGPKRASVVEVIGRFDDPRSASLIAMHTHGVPDEFPQAVLDEAAKVKPLPAQREDLTRIPLITIDPEDARDHDDAVFAEPDGQRLARHRRHRRRRRLCASRHGAGSRSLSARQLHLFPGSRRADAAGASVGRPMLAARRRTARDDGVRDVLQRRRPQALAPHCSRQDAVCGEAVLSPGAGCDRRQCRTPRRSRCSKMC